MPMKCRINSAGDESEIFLSGKFIFETCRCFFEVYELAVSRHETRTILVDLTGTVYLDSSALGALLFAREKAEKRGRIMQIRVAKASPHATLVSAKVDQLFKVLWV